jgi:hypothetical protein
MKRRKISEDFYRNAYDSVFKGIPPKEIQDGLSEDDLNRDLESRPQSEVHGIKIYYITGPMEFAHPGITNVIKAKVEETFHQVHGSKFDFLHDFSRLLLIMSPVLPIFDEDSGYRGVGKEYTVVRNDEETVSLLLSGEFLTENMEGFAFNGVVSHELVELNYTEENSRMLIKIPPNLPSKLTREIAVDERVYAINPIYCRDMKVIDFEGDFKEIVKITDNTITGNTIVGVSALSVYLPCLKHGDPYGKKLRKRVMDTIRSRNPKLEIMALRYERVLSKFPLYNPTPQNYREASEFLKTVNF